MNEPCVEPLFPRHHILNFQTPLGWRSQYNSCAYCNRCGCCAQVCPTYHLFHEETFSPRGRNQMLRLALEGKIKLSAQNTVLTGSLTSCTLCGRCNRACAGHIPTAEHVLELRRALHLRVLPRLLHTFLNWRDTAPRGFACAARTALFLRRLGLVKVLRFFYLTRLPGFTWLNRLDDILPSRTPRLTAVLHADEKTNVPDKPDVIYLPSLEAEFILPQIARGTLDLLRGKKKTVRLWRNQSCGLFAYVYGDVRQSRRTLRRLLHRYAQTGNGKLPLLTDSLDVYYFLKRAPQLFFGKKHWQARAQQLADQVHFVTDYMPARPTLKTPPAGPVQLEYGALFERQGKPLEKAQQICYTLFGKNLVQCSYTDADIPAFGYVFSAPESAEQIGLKTVERIARTQTKTVFALSGLAALELAYFLKRFYPAAEAQHFVHVNR